MSALKHAYARLKYPSPATRLGYFDRLVAQLRT